MAQLYRHFDKNGVLLYVGISISALRRLSQHVGSRWVNDIAQVTIEHFSTRQEALRAEHKAIVAEKPKFNKTHTRSRVDVPDIDVPDTHVPDTNEPGPLHSGEIIGGILDDIGVSVRGAATAMGVSHNALANLVRGDAAISPDMAVRLCAYMGNGPEGDEFWLRLQMTYDLWHARKRLKAEAAKIKPAPRDPKDAVTAA